MHQPDDNLQAAPHAIRRFLLPVVLLLALVVGTFAHVAHEGFVDWDDPLHVLENPYLLPVTPAHLAAFWRAPYEGLYAPVAYMAFAALSQIAPLASPAIAPCGGVTTFNPAVFHVANLTLHTLNAVLVYALLCRLTRKEWASFAGAVLFAVHPLQVESVAWISELRGLLGATFSLAALHAYLSFAGPTLKTKVSYVWYAVATLLFAAALLSKPSTVTLPLIALALEWGVYRRPLRSGMLALAPWCVGGLACVLVTRTAQPVDASICVPILQRVAVAGDALGFYLVKLFAPVSLAADYGRTPHFAIHHAAWLAGFAVSVAISFAAYRFRERFPLLAVGWVVFVVALLPVLGFVPFFFQSFSTTTDRYAYFALIGPSLAVASLLSTLRPATVKLAAALLACSLAPLALVQVRVWDNSLTLFHHAIAVNPTSGPMHYCLAHYEFCAEHYQAAEAEDRKAIALRPRYAEAFCNLGAIFLSENRYNDALEAYRTAVALNPDIPVGEQGEAEVLGRIDALKGDYKDAALQYQIDIRLNSNDATAHYNLATVYTAEQRFPQAEAECRLAIALQPVYAEAYCNLGGLLASEGRFDDALVAYRTAAAQSPTLTVAQQGIAAVEAAKRGEG